MRGKKNVSVGDILTNNDGCVAVVLECRNYREVVIKFLDEHSFIKTFPQCALQKGSFRNPFYKSFYGIGYIGYGSFKSGYKDSHTKAYAVWSSMFCRCYCEKFLSRSPSYVGCSVSPEWHNFQNFAKWFYSQKGFDEGFHLDKDIKVSGNKIYGENTCFLIPKELNLLLVAKSGVDTALPQGVYINNRNKDFMFRITRGGEKHVVKGFKKPEDAFTAYKECKEAYIRQVANDFRHKISEDAYASLMKYRLPI